MNDNWWLSIAMWVLLLHPLIIGVAHGSGIRQHCELKYQYPRYHDKFCTVRLHQHKRYICTSFGGGGSSGTGSSNSSNNASLSTNVHSGNAFTQSGHSGHGVGNSSSFSPIVPIGSLPPMPPVIGIPTPIVGTGISGLMLVVFWLFVRRKLFN